MSDILKTKNELISERFSSTDSYSTWLYKNIENIQELKIGKLNPEYSLVIMLPSVERKVTDAGLEIPADAVERGTHCLLWGLQADRQTVCFNDDSLLCIRPYGNIRISDSVYLVPNENIMFSISG